MRAPAPALRLPAVGAMLLLLAGATTGPALACTPPLAGRPAATLQSERYVLAFRPNPAAVAVDSRFALEIAICARDGRTLPDYVMVDAHMPDHRHGMNYRPVLTATGHGTYRAEGFLFHMPGKWELTFELRHGGQSDRLAHALMIE